MRGNEARPGRSKAVSQPAPFSRRAHCERAMRLNPSEWVSARSGLAPLAAGALLFFACAKKSRQKKHPPAVRPPHAAGSHSRREFSDRASCPGRKRRTSMCAALRVLPAVTAGPKGPQKPARTNPARTPLPWLFGFPMRHGERARSEAQGVPPGACFFGSFLCTSKEVFLNSRMAGQGTPPRRAAPCQAARMAPALKTPTPRPICWT